ncbi:MAG: HAMP domain-containing protein [Proteobacteria bacterium]|nr:HAMP domain-containing protein [Pseudomonadota bacterium]
MKLGIKQKLALIFFMFFLIFSGTVFVLLTNVQRMVDTTERIVSKNKKVAELAEILQASLLDMDANSKKFNLLKKKRYYELFEKSQNNFESALQQAVLLSGLSENSNSPWRQLEDSYQLHSSNFPPIESAPEIGFEWVADHILAEWLENISRAKKQNQQEIELALRELNEASRISARNGLLSFCASILVGLIGVWYISRAIFSPLKTLTGRLRGISFDTPQEPIRLRGGDEFNELANAFNDMSRQLNEEETIRAEFIATLSHEIRTPLSSIHESVNMIVEEVFGSINDKQRKFLEIASVEIKRITKLLNYLLNVGVLEIDARKANSFHLNTESVVINSAELFSATAEKKKVTLKMDNFHDCPQLFGVREEIQQVFVNIIGNAIKYSPEEGKVTLSWERDKERKFLLFHVADAGPGIADDERSLIFTKYYRTKNVRGHLDGVGLGLAISRRIVTSYGGHIEVANNSGQGCTFSFSLPTHPLTTSSSV